MSIAKPNRKPSSPSFNGWIFDKRSNEEKSMKTTVQQFGSLLSIFVVSMLVALWVPTELNAQGNPYYETTADNGSSAVRNEIADGYSSYKIFDVGCVEGALNGYFRPENWEIQVSGVGNIPSMRVDELGGSSIDVHPGQTVSLSILIPAEGHLLVDWSWTASADSSSAYSVQSEKTSEWLGSRGAYFSDAFLPNNRFKLTLTNEGSKKSVFHFTYFQFLTQARKVAIQADAFGRPFNAQVLELGAEISDILFPLAMEISDRSDLDPAVAGVPFLDEDGHPGSKYDQQLLKDGSFGFRVSYEDQVGTENGRQVIYREWVITDPCSGNQISNTQAIYLRESSTGNTPMLGKSRP